MTAWIVVGAEFLFGAAVAALALRRVTRAGRAPDGAHYRTVCGHELRAATPIELVGVTDEHCAGCPSCLSWEEVA